MVKFNVAIVEPRVRFSAGACRTLLPPRSVLLAPSGAVMVLKGVGVVWEVGGVNGRRWRSACGCDNGRRERGARSSSRDHQIVPPSEALLVRLCMCPLCLLSQDTRTPAGAAVEA